MFPREIAPGVHWLGWCLETDAVVPGETVHVPAHCYLIIGDRRALLFDTCQPENWPRLERQLDDLLGPRSLDFVVPSHQEIPHAGNLGRLLQKYPEAVVAGDVRDYHLYVPAAETRSRPIAPGSSVELGRAHRFTVLDAPIKDHPATVWGYEEHQQVLFSADGFGFVHTPRLKSEAVEALDPPGLHLPGECACLTSELRTFGALPTPHEVEIASRGALHWARHVDMSPFLADLRELLRVRPARRIAPAHGHVIDNVGEVLPVIEQAYRERYTG